MVNSMCLRPAAHAFRVSKILALLMLLGASSLAPADELVFGEARLLPGDAVLGAPAGMQTEPDLARGGDVFLAVWSDYRSSPHDYPPFASEGSGADIYGARMDAGGNVLDLGAFTIRQDLGDQVEPRVAWNGQNWLVVWRQETQTLPTYEELLGVRVSPAGLVLDPEPIVIHDNQSYYTDFALAGGDGGWLVLCQANGPLDGIVGVRVGGDGGVLNPGGTLIHGTSFLLSFDLTFAQDQYLIVWSGSFDFPQARRYTPDLQLIGTSYPPFGQKVATDGSGFLLVYASGSPPLATVEGVLLDRDGVLGTPFTLYTAGNQAGTCCADANWDGAQYWVSWGQTALARVTADGQVLDPGGFNFDPVTEHMSTPRFAGAPGGGLAFVFHDGVNGAGYPKDILSGRVSAAGQLENEALLSYGAPAQLESDFAEGDGTHLIVFLSETSRDGRILAQRIDASGTALDTEPIEVAAGPRPGLGLPSLGPPGAAWNGSVFMITWSDGLQIYARRMLPDGSLLDEAPLIVMDGHSPDLAAVGSVFLVVGLDYLMDNPHWQATHSMRVDGTTGANLDPEPNALGGFVIYARYPHVVDWVDRWLVVWQQNLSHDNTIAGTTAAIVDADGTTPGIIDVPLGWRPDVAVSDDAALFVAVTGTVASATTDLAGIIMTADGNFSGPSFLISGAFDKQLRPAATWNGTEFIVAWEDKRHAEIYFDERTDIYGARVSGDGTVLDPAGFALAAAVEPELQPAFMSAGNTTLLAVSSLRTEPELGAYRLGIMTGGGDTAAPNTPIASSDRAIRLFGAYPNPANPSTEIRFELKQAAEVSLNIYDVGGRLVRTLLENRAFDAGAAPINIRWDGFDGKGRAVKSGVYFYELKAMRTKAKGKLVILK